MKIEIKDNEVHLVTDKVIDSYKWFYHHSYKSKLNQIGKSKSSVGWFGNGIYICEVTINGKVKLVNGDFSKNAITDKTKYTLLPKKIKARVADWDFTKVTEEQIPLIEKFVKEEDISELVMIHNNLKLSPIKYCCGNLNFILTNFKTYLDDMQRGESKMVEN